MIVRQCWEAIPEHFPWVQVGVFQIMPNHIHGIVSIRPSAKSVGTRHAVSLQKNSGGKFGKPEHGSLSTIIRSFKSAVTKQVHELELSVERTIWQSRFHDHIIRDDVDHFFVQQYIELNPLFWHLDVENPLVFDDEKNIEALRAVLKSQLHFDHRAIEYLVQNEIDYRVWRNQG